MKTAKGWGGGVNWPWQGEMRFHLFSGVLNGGERRSPNLVATGEGLVNHCLWGGNN